MEETTSLDTFITLPTLLRVRELHDQLTKPIFLLKDVGVLYRTVLHWDQQGLLEHSREESEWRRYDYMQFVWIKIIHDLRTFGVPIPTIEKVKKNILDKIDYQWLCDLLNINLETLDRLNPEDSTIMRSYLESIEDNLDPTLSVSILELMIIETLTSKIPVSLIVFTDGDTIPFYENQVLEPTQLQRIANDTYIKVSVTAILKDFFSQDKETFLVPQLSILSENEKKLLEIIHSGNYETVSISFKNRKMRSLELIKEQNVKRKIVDILQDCKYQNIVIKSHKGEITKIQNTIKVMLD